MAKGVLDVCDAHMQAQADGELDENIIVNGLRVIGNLAFNEEAANICGKDGAIEKILQLSNRDSANIRGASYKAFSGICRSEKMSNAMSKSTMLRLVEDYSTYAEDTHFIKEGTQFLGNICVHKSAAETVQNTDIVKQQATLLEKYKDKNPKLAISLLKPLHNMARSAGPAVKQHLKDQQIVELCERILAVVMADDTKIAAKQVINAINFDESALEDKKFLDFDKREKVEAKSAKDIFGDDKHELEIAELPNATKNFLQSGALLTKHSKTAQPRSRHVYVDADLKYIIWKDPKKKETDDTRMKVHMIKDIEVGRVTEQLKRKRFGKYLADENRCFTIRTRERTLDLEAQSEAEREKWVKHIKLVILWCKQNKQNRKDYAKLSETLI
jgi:hypothetical protein